MTTPHPSELLTKEQEARAQAIEGYWHKIANESLASGLLKQEDAAKQLVTLTGALQGLYFAVLAFTDIKEQISGMLILLFMLPALFWFGSLIFATLVFVPQPSQEADLDNFRATAWLDIRASYITASVSKYRWLRWSHLFLIISFFMVLAVLAYLPALPVPAAKGSTQIVTVTPLP